MNPRTPIFAPLQKLFAALFTGLLVCPGLAQDEGSLAGKVAVLELSEFTLVESARTEHLYQMLDRAKSDGAAAVVLEIDSPGGLAISTRRAMEKLAALDSVKTHALIKGEAVGGAALVALATDAIYFAPDAAMGSSQEKYIDWRGKKEALPDRLVDKSYEDFADVMKAAVSAKGRDSVLVDGFIDKSIEVKIGDQVLSEEDDVLVLEGDSPVSAGKAATAQAVVQAAGLAGDLIRLDYVATEPEQEEQPEQEDEGPPAPEEENLGIGETRQEHYGGKVVVIEVGRESLIRKTKFEFMRRILERAVEQRAEAVVFDMHTPGGYLWETRDLMTDLQSVNIPTYAFVNPEASSAGSMIAIATDKIYMHEPSTIGAAAIVAGGEGLDGTMREKVERTFLDTVKEIAEAKGRDPELCQAFVRPEIEYYLSIPVVEADGRLGERPILSIKEGELLSLNSKEATEIVDGRPLFADGVAQTLEELMEKEGLKGEVVRAKALGFEAVADWIVKIAPFLLLLAFAGFYVEINSPGFGAPGIVALIMFAIFFFGHQVAGKLAGYEVIGVFLIGVALLVVEFFILPGTLIFGVVGALLVIGSLLFAMLDRFDFSSVGGEFDWERLLSGLGTPITNLIIAMGGAAVLVVVLMRYLPELPIMKRRMLVGVSSGGTGHRTLTSVSGGRVSEAAPDLVGLEGTAQCDLRPAGKGMFGDRLLDITTEAEFLEAGTAVRVVKEEGSRIVVEAV